MDRHRPDRRHTDALRPADDVRWGLGDAAVCYIAGLVISALLFDLAGGAPGQRSYPVIVPIAGFVGLWLGIGGGAVLVSWWRGSGSLRRDYGWQFDWLDPLIGLGVGVILQLVAVPLVSWPVNLLWDGDISEPARSSLESVTSGRWILVVAIAAAAPIIEELYFRGLLLRSINRKVHDGIAVAVSAVVFAATHFQAAQFPGLLVVGLALATLVRRFGRLGPAVAAHAAFNSTAVMLLS